MDFQDSLPIRILIHFQNCKIKEQVFYFRRSNTFAEVGQMVSSSLKTLLNVSQNSKLPFSFHARDGKLIPWTTLQKKKLKDEYPPSVQMIEYWVILPMTEKATEASSIKTPSVSETQQFKTKIETKIENQNQILTKNSSIQNPAQPQIQSSNPAQPQPASPAQTPNPAHLQSTSQLQTQNPAHLQSTSQLQTQNPAQPQLQDQLPNPAINSSEKVEKSTQPSNETKPNIHNGSSSISSSIPSSTCPNKPVKNSKITKLSEEERIRQSLERQKERERKMKEKEALKRQEEERLKKEKENASEDQLKALKLKDEERRQADKLLRGYGDLDMYIPLPDPRVTLKTDEEVKREEEEEKMKKEFGLATGEQWVKTEFGWQRSILSPDRYKSPPSVQFLPSWLFDELNFTFGLRRNSSSDFRDTCIMLDKIFVQYYCNTGWLRPHLLGYLKLVDTQMERGGTEFAEAEQICDLAIHLFENALNTIEKSQRSKQAHNPQPVNLIKELLQNFQKKKMELINKQKAIPRSASALNAYVPNALWIEIFSYFDTPRDLCAVSEVCYLWSCLANTPILYENLMKRKFNSVYHSLLKNPEPKNWKEEFVRSYKQNFSSDWDIVGMYQCDKCSQFYWAGQNTMCCASNYSSKHKRTTPKITPHQIVNRILCRKVPLVSDVTFF